MDNIFKLFYILFIFNIFNICARGRTFEDLSKITTSDMISHEGYPAEDHEVVTEDGYVLTVYRIPGPPGSTPVLVQHGFLASSFDWVVAGKDKALADKGYDVWLGNARGSTNSRRHVKLDPSDPIFWNFSFHEMGVYDLPAVITYITDFRNASLIYVGHSMGTTMSYVMATERLDMTDRVKVIFSFASIAYMRKWTSPIRLLSIFPHELEVNFFIAGYNPSQYNYNILPLTNSHLPAGSSMKTMLHLLQLGKTGEFQHYNYGPNGNKIVYDSLEPPEYDLSKIRIPIGIFWSDNDLFCHPSDAQAFYKKIPKKVLTYRIPHPLFLSILCGQSTLRRWFTQNFYRPWKTTDL